MLSGELWKVKSTHLKVPKAEKHSYNIRKLRLEVAGRYMHGMEAISVRLGPH